MIGRTITHPDASNSGERWESKQLVHEDDRRQLFEAKDASALETKLEDTHFGNTHLCNTPVLVVSGILWPHGPNFDHISQIPNVTSYLGQKDCISRSKVVQLGNFKFSTLQDPQNPKLAPHGPDGTPEREKGLESS